jgi:hypothetical protein
MVVFEVVAAVAAVAELVGVFNSSVTIFRDWSEQRGARREHAENQKLE